MAKFEDVLPALRKGKKIRCKNWDDGSYIYRNDIGNILNAWNEMDNDMSAFIINGNWEIFEEPKQKVKYYPALFECKEGDKITYEIFGKYKDDKELIDEKNKPYQISYPVMPPITKKFIRLVTEIPEFIEERYE